MRTFLEAKGEKKGRDPEIEYANNLEMVEFSEQFSSDITHIWLGWHSLLGTWDPVLLLFSAPSGLGPRPSFQSLTLRWPHCFCHRPWQ